MNFNEKELQLLMAALVWYNNTAFHNEVTGEQNLPKPESLLDLYKKVEKEWINQVGPQFAVDVRS